MTRGEKNGGAPEARGPKSQGEEFPKSVNVGRGQGGHGKGMVMGMAMEGDFQSYGVVTE